MATSGKTSILIVESDVAKCEALRAMLSPRRYRAESVRDFAEGAALLSEGRHDAYLIGTGRARKEGISLIRKSAHFDIGPMILMTSGEDDNLGDSAIAVGACDCLARDRTDGDLLDRVIRRSLARAERIRHLQRERDRFAQMAQCDPLTGLANRRRLLEVLNERLRNRDDNHGGLLYLDLDGFKPVNDRLGHASGDDVLRDVATRLVKCVRHRDLVARLGGDEFVVLLSELGDRGAAREAAETVAKKIVRAISQPYRIDDRDGLTHIVNVGASVGVALYPDDGARPEILIRSADAAMYTAKNGQRRYCFRSSASVESLQPRRRRRRRREG